MPYFFLTLLAVVALLFLVVTGCKDENNKTGKTNDPKGNVVVVNKQNPSVFVLLDRKEMQKKLQQLSKTPPTTPMAMGAMCYEQAMAPERAEYTCPTCGEKTLYTDLFAQTVEWELPGCRRLLESIPSNLAKLDESEFCKKCKPSIQTPQLALLIYYKNEDKPHRVTNITSNDIKLLDEFLKGQDKHKGSYDEESPLLNHLSRLEEILGVKKGE